MRIETDVRDGGPAGPAPARTSWGVVGMVVLAGVGVALQVGKLVAALPAVRTDLGIGLTLGGVVLAAFTVVSALTGAVLGTVVARTGAARAVVGGLLLVAAGSALGGLTVSGTQLLATTAVEGAGYVAVVVAAPSLIARVTAARERGLAFGLWGTYMPGGQAIMTVVAPLLLAAWTWRGMWFVNAALLAACAGAAWIVLVRRVPAHEDAAARPSGRRLRADLRAVLRTPATRLLPLAFGLYSLQFIAVTGFLPTVYGRQGLGPATSTTLTATVIAVNALGNLGAGMLLRRDAPYWLLVAVASGAMGVAAVGVFSPGLPLAATYACALAFSALGGLLPATVMAAVPALAPDPALVPTTNGLVVQAIGVGMMIGPIAAGALADAVGGWQATPLIVTTTAAVVVLVALRVRTVERSRRPR